MKSGIAKKIIIRFALFLFLVAVVFVSFFISRRFSPSKTISIPVRIRLLHDAGMIRLGKDTHCRTIKETSSGEDEEYVFHMPVDVLPEGAGIKVGQNSLNVSRIRIFSAPEGKVSLNEIFYRGEIEIANTGKGLDVINHIDLEDYLKGVIPREMNHLWPVQALRAQAIVSRSFAVHEARRRNGKEYDLTADTFSQVYGGRSGERWFTSRAVDATKGKVLMYKGKLLPGYFHSSCGGHTEDIAEIWGKSTPPLKGVKCRWCKWLPHHRWQVKVPVKTIVRKISDRGYPIKDITAIREGGRNDSRRHNYVRIKADNRWFEISTSEFRAAIGGNVLKSANFQVKRYPLFYLFSGYGWGHGVGMCQWGAFGAAAKGFNAAKILSEYYPGAEIGDLKELYEK